MSNKAPELIHLSISDLRAKRVDLDSKLARLNSQVTGLRIEIQNFTHEASAIDNELRRRSIPVQEPRLSDHAILRYIERAFNIDIDAIKERIMTPDVVQAIKNGASAVTVEGIKFKIKDNAIITAFAPDIPKAKTKKFRPVDELKEGLDDFYNEEN